MPDHHDPSYRNPFSRRTSYDPLPPGYSWARPIYPGNRQTSRSRSRQRSTSYSHDPESSNPRRRSSSIIGGLANYLYGTPMPTRSASVRQTRQESTHGTSRRRSSSTRPSPMRSASVRQTRQESTHDTPRRRSSSIRRPSLMHNLFGTSSSTTFRNKTREEKATYHREYYAANAERIQARRRGEVVEPRAKKAKTPESSPTTRRERSAYQREYYAKNAERINAKRREEVAQGTESAVRRRQNQYARDREHRAQNDEVAQRKREQLKKYQAPEYRDRYNANRRRRRAESSKTHSQEVIQIDSDSD
ncbi:hypothetical protein LTR70_007011 [Exophiala xenobiotica]|uniref:Uncharacterized protein n=1 Tax=Lithohypha guttulata TaxID=1690604 RepID=A0ABR0K4M9_9EURO|nr:hypothetical protein LTR24_006872 [Lithohypha guttulata]KAK5314712.1 hypothetical protein LTR70_007011 [Exophiala xenobiotica]